MKMKRVKGGLCAVKGVSAYGIKEGNMGLALIEGKGIAVGMFTSNKIKAAPVRFTERQLEGGGRKNKCNNCKQRMCKQLYWRKRDEGRRRNGRTRFFFVRG